MAIIIISVCFPFSIWPQDQYSGARTVTKKICRLATPLPKISHKLWLFLEWKIQIKLGQNNKGSEVPLLKQDCNLNRKVSLMSIVKKSPWSNQGKTKSSAMDLKRRHKENWLTWPQDFTEGRWSILFSTLDRTLGVNEFFRQRIKLLIFFLSGSFS